MRKVNHQNYKTNNTTDVLIIDGIYKFLLPQLHFLKKDLEIPLKSTLGKTRTKPKRLVTWNLILGHSLKALFYLLNFSKSVRRQSMSWIPEDRLFLPNLRKDSSMNQCLFVFLHEAASILSSSGAPTSMAREPLQLNNNTIKHLL